MAEVRLDLEGLTCASCAARIEKRLNTLDGVEATVNFATEQATVQTRADVPVEELLGAVEAAGYRAQLVTGAHEPNRQEGDRHHDPVRRDARWRRSASCSRSAPRRPVRCARGLRCWSL